MLITIQKNEEFEEIKKILPVSVASDFDSIQPYLEAAEVDHLEPILGSTLYEHLQGFYENPDRTDAWLGQNKTTWSNLLTRVQRAIVNLAYWMGYDLLSVTADAAGFHREETESRKSLFRYQEENLKAGFRNNGFNAIDGVLAFLETNITIFPDFKSSPFYSIRKTSIIPNTQSFDKIYFIGGSRLVFLKFQRFIDQVEDFTMQSVLGRELYIKLKTELAKDQPEDRMTSLLPWLQKPLVYLAVAKGLTEIGVNITDRAVFLESQAASFQNSLEQTPVKDSTLSMIIRAADQAGDQYLAALKSHLASDPEKWPEYSGQTGSVYSRDNTDKKTTWIG